MPDFADVLLYTLSAWKETPWRRYRRAFGGLLQACEPRPVEPAAGQDDHLRALRTLESLGHCDLDESTSGIRVVIAVPSLSLLPWTGLPRAVLCGARSPSTLTDLRAASAPFGSRVAITAAPHARVSPFAPARITIQGDSVSSLREFAEVAGLLMGAVPAAWELTEASQSLGDYLSALSWQAEPELNWPRSDFHPARLRFGPPGDVDCPLRLSRYRNERTMRLVHQLRRHDEAAYVDPRWGRLAVLEACGLPVLTYSGEVGEVLAPRFVPLPTLIARALTLCSGWSAEGAEDPEIHYSGVPSDVFDAVAAKLGQT